MGILDVPGIPAKQAKRLFSPAAISQMGVSIQSLVPSFYKYEANPLLTSVQGGAGTDDAEGASITWPWIIDTRTTPFADDALDTYYMYYAADHAPDFNPGGIFMAHAPSPLGPWTVYGKVWGPATVPSPVDGTAWNMRQLDTPSPIVVPAGAAGFEAEIPNGGINLLCEVFSFPGATGQTTIRTTSPDGITGWSNPVIAIDKPAGNVMPGNGHTGYARPYPLGGTRYVATHLMGGEDSPHFAVSYSSDYGRTWRMDPRLLGYGFEFGLQAGWRVDWLQQCLVEWRGDMWMIAGLRPPTYGGAEVPVKWVAGPLRDDFRGFKRPPTLITPPAQPWENGMISSPYYALEAGGQIYLYYRGGDRHGAIGVAILDLPEGAA